MLKKLTVAILLALFLLVSTFTPIVRAQEDGSWYNQSFQEWYTKVYDSSNPSEIFGERYTAAQVQWILYGLWAFLINSTTNKEVATCFLSGQIDECVQILNSLVSNAKSSEQFANKEGGRKPTLLGSIFEDRPISGIYYFKQIARKLKIIPEAQAQANVGFGFSNLNTVLDLWRAVRNITFVLFVLIIVAMSFMIMFRVKISPQTVITVQSALPKLVVALILVTFSYAIAGFLVDLMYVFTGLISLLLAPFLNKESVELFNELIKGPFNLGIFGYTLGYLGLFSVFGILILFMQGGLPGAATALVTGLGIALLSFITGAWGLVLLFLFVVALIVLLWFIIRILWTMIRAFASILLLVIFAPLQIALGAIVPSMGFGAWLKSFVANLAVFPTIGILFQLAFIFLYKALEVAWIAFKGDVSIISILTALVSIFFPPASGIYGSLTSIQSNTGWPPLLGIGERFLALVYLGVSFVVFTLIPKTSDIIKGMIEGKPFSYGSAIGETFAPLTTGRKTYAGYRAGEAAKEYKTLMDTQGAPPSAVRAARIKQALWEMISR